MYTIEQSKLYSDEILRKLCNTLRNGSTRTAACSALGIHRDTLYTWMSVSSDIADAVTRAEGEFRAELEQKFAVHALNGDDWRACHAFLQSHPKMKQDWGAQLNLGQVPTATLREMLEGEGQAEETAWPLMQATQPLIEAAVTEAPDQPMEVEQQPAYNVTREAEPPGPDHQDG